MLRPNWSYKPVGFINRCTYCIHIIINRRNEGERINCDKCGKIFSHKNSLRKHIKRTHGYKCEMCGVKANNETELKNHVEKVHRGTGNHFLASNPKRKSGESDHRNKSGGPESGLTGVKSVSDLRYSKSVAKCPYCGSSMLKSSLSRHFKRVHPDITNKISNVDTVNRVSL